MFLFPDDCGVYIRVTTPGDGPEGDMHDINNCEVLVYRQVWVGAELFGR